MPEQMSVYLDRVYYSEATHEKLKVRGLASTIAEKNASRLRYRLQTVG